jgi:RNA polymerase sigma factor (TIGR02999 family)
MKSPAPGEVTQLLAMCRAGQRNALSQLVAMLYPELRELAHRSKKNRAGMHTLQTTGLLHETFLKLMRSGKVLSEDRTHFLALCAFVMRGILVDDARARVALKRGGPAARVQFDENLHPGVYEPAEVVRLHDALTALAEVDHRKSQVVELRFFGGLNVEETAEALGISRETALRDWRFARAWLKSAMNEAG